MIDHETKEMKNTNEDKQTLPSFEKKFLYFIPFAVDMDNKMIVTILEMTFVL